MLRGFRWVLWEWKKKNVASVFNEKEFMILLFFLESFQAWVSQRNDLVAQAGQDRVQLGCVILLQLPAISGLPMMCVP